jgi:hypothetical protein
MAQQIAICASLLKGGTAWHAAAVCKGKGLLIKGSITYVRDELIHLAGVEQRHGDACRDGQVECEFERLQRQSAPHKGLESSL